MTSGMTETTPSSLGVPSSSRVAPLIKQDKVHGSLYTDPAIFAEELQKIWYRSWVFVGHESEVAQPGDYVCIQAFVNPTAANDEVITTRKLAGLAATPG